MKRTFGLLTALLLIASPEVSAAEPRACEFVAWGFGYIKVKEEGVPWTYSVSASGPSWKHAPYGYHAPGYLARKSCTSFGLYHFGSFVPPPSRAEHKRPATVGERVERRSEVFGYPYFPLGPDGLDHQAARDKIVVGTLAGYAVLYSLKGPVAERLRDHVEGKVPSLLVVSLTDGCVTLTLAPRCLTTAS